MIKLEGDLREEWSDLPTSFRLFEYRQLAGEPCFEAQNPDLNREGARNAKFVRHFLATFAPLR